MTADSKVGRCLKLRNQMICITMLKKNDFFPQYHLNLFTVYRELCAFVLFSRLSSFAVRERTLNHEKCPFLIFLKRNNLILLKIFPYTFTLKSVQINIFCKIITSYNSGMFIYGYLKHIQLWKTIITNKTLPKASQKSPQFANYNTLII